jgi:hypothetical protein
LACHWFIFIFLSPSFELIQNIYIRFHEFRDCILTSLLRKYCFSRFNSGFCRMILNILILKSSYFLHICKIIIDLLNFSAQICFIKRTSTISMSWFLKIFNLYCLPKLYFQFFFFFSNFNNSYFRENKSQEKNQNFNLIHIVFIAW